MRWGTTFSKLHSTFMAFHTACRAFRRKRGLSLWRVWATMGRPLGDIGATSGHTWGKPGTDEGDPRATLQLLRDRRAFTRGGLGVTSGSSRQSRSDKTSFGASTPACKFGSFKPCA